MNKLPVCLLCKKRKVKQQEWKTEEEKMYCLTCDVFRRFCEQLANILQLRADEGKMGRRIYIKLGNELRSREEKMFDDLVGKESSKVILD